MAKRTLRPRHQDEIRDKIQVSQLINRVQDYALGKLDDTEVSPNRLNAIKLLLAKTIPDLSSVQLTGDPENPVSINSTLNVASLNEEQLRAIASIQIK